tara:strand:+ start:606 stop:1958 length:1353 start_codon:yes stop_codon:yes gene_type:complete
MATPNIVPKAISEGGLGTSAKAWGKLFISNPSTGGTPAVKITNADVNQHGISLIALNTTANVLNLQSTSLTTANAINIDCNSLTTGSAINLDIDDALTTNVQTSLLNIDYDKSGVTADGQSNGITGLNININDAATNHANSTIVHTGVNVVIDAASNQGTIHHIGYDVTATDGDTAKTIGYRSRLENGGIDFEALSSAAAADMFTIATGAAGATTLETIDSSGAAAHIAVIADGNVDIDGLVLTLDAATSIELESATNVTGALKATGAVTGRNYRTMYIDAAAMVPAVTNGAIANTEEMHATNFTTLDFLSFSTSTEQYADFKIVMPEQYNNGTIKAKFYWKPADAEASVSVVWGIKAYAATNSDALTGASGVWGTEQVIEDVSLNTVDDLHISATTPAVTIAGTPAEGKLVFVRVFRKVAATDDDYADAAELLGVNLQYVESETASVAW